MASKTSNQASSKGLDAGKYRKQYQLRTSNGQFNLFSKKKIQLSGIFCIAGLLAVPIIPDKCSSAVLANQLNPNSSAARYMTACATMQVLLKAVRVLAAYCVTARR